VTDFVEHVLDGVSRLANEHIALIERAERAAKLIDWPESRAVTSAVEAMDRGEDGASERFLRAIDALLEVTERTLAGPAVVTGNVDEA
jgi:hypothetical protein